MAVFRIPRFNRRKPAAGLPRRGDYVSCDGTLYRIELAAREGVLLEDCRTGDLCGLELADCERLKHVEPAMFGP